MATYKVLQDIEAEDKFVGPLTLKQFIFAGIFVICGYASFWSIVRSFPYTLVLTGPIMLICGVLAWPWSSTQSTEVWLFAKIRFFLKPHRRIWDQSGMKQLVTITAPKRDERVYTNGLDDNEVHSRLKALANTIDSRGWAVKNVNVNMYTQPGFMGSDTDSDRLVGASTLPQDVANVDIQASDDILDDSNPIAHHLAQMVQASGQARQQQVRAQMTQAAQGKPAADNGNWFTRQAATPIQPAKEVKRLATKKQAAKKYEKASEPHHTKHTKHSEKQASPKVTPHHDPDIIELAKSNDLNVATLARQAEQARKKEPPADEVVISLR